MKGILILLTLALAACAAMFEAPRYPLEAAPTQVAACGLGARAWRVVNGANRRSRRQARQAARGA